MHRSKLSRLRTRHIVAAVLVAVGLCGATMAVGSLSQVAGAATPVARAIRLGTPAFVPNWAARLGPVSRSNVMTVDIVLKPRDPAALESFAMAVSTPGSPLYRHYLHAGAFPSVFGPRPRTISSVATWLRSRGLRPSAISADHLIFHVTATAAQLEHAFSISLERYDVQGRTAFANTDAPLLSGEVAGAVQGVVGLSNVVLPHPELLRPAKQSVKPEGTPHVVTGGPQPCSAAVTVGTDSGSYTADQLAHAYRFSSLYAAGDFGAGQTVAIFELEPNLTTDISAYQSCYGTSASVTYTKVDGGAGSGAGVGEAALDIEDVIGLAPEAAIDVYQAPNSDTGLLDDYSAMVTADAAKDISTSWGECEAQSGSSLLDSENTIFTMAASQGQTVFAASGDSGSEDCSSDALAVDDPGSQPFVTGVGGTNLSALGPPPTQSVWHASGGGISEQWKMPSYQSGAPSSLNVINSDSSGTPCGASAGQYCREDPDVSADADPEDGYVVYYDGAWGAIGGTSAAAPLWAAFMTLVNGWSGCSDTSIGFANPALYRIAGTSAYSSSFSDITIGDNDYTGTNGGKFPAGTGYDMASGLGTPIGSGLPVALCGGSLTYTVTVTNPGKQAGTVGKKLSLQIVATDSGGLPLTYAATGLPKGLKLNASTGLIRGTPHTAGKSEVLVTATDYTGATGSATFIWRVKS